MFGVLCHCGKNGLSERNALPSSDGVCNGHSLTGDAQPAEHVRFLSHSSLDTLSQHPQLPLVHRLTWPRAAQHCTAPNLDAVLEARKPILRSRNNAMPALTVHKTSRNQPHPTQAARKAAGHVKLAAAQVTVSCCCYRLTGRHIGHLCCTEHVQ